MFDQQLTSDQQTVVTGIGRTGSDIVVHGLAGTGKTTLFTGGLITLHDPLYLAPSNKALAILSGKLALAAPGARPNVQTVFAASHKGGKPWTKCVRCDVLLTDNALYVAHRGHALRTGFTRQEEGPSAQYLAARDIIIDEASMVSAADREILERFREPWHRFIYVGDPAQLPPVTGLGMFQQMADRGVLPLHTMTEITRQAAGSPIIQLAHRVRSEQISNPRIIREGFELPEDQVELFEIGAQILCWTNRVRVQMNRKFRQWKWGVDVTDADPRAGDEVYIGMIGGAAMRKGDVAVVLAVESDVDPLMVNLHLSERTTGQVQWVRVERAGFGDPNWLTGGQSNGPARVDYSYCLTVHRAQGSEWENVVLICDVPGNAAPAVVAQWLYTGITRASQTLYLA